MNKEEIEHRIKNYTMVKELAEERLIELKSQLEAEKPKLQRGDFGINFDKNKDGKLHFPVIAIKKKLNDPSLDIVYKDGSRELGKGKSVDGVTWFGNIFEMMEGWGEDFKNAVLKNSYDGRTFFIQKSELNETDLYLGIEDRRKRMGIYLTESEAYEIWLKLGHALADTKPKQT